MKILNHRGKNVTPAEHALVVMFAKRCLRELGKKKYELPPFHAPLQVITKCRGQRAYGGSDSITIDLAKYRRKEDAFNEYASINSDPVIGFLRGSPERLLFCIVAHEVAHHVHKRYARRAPWYRDSKPHGPTWRYIYGWLRRELVNDYSEDQTMNSKTLTFDELDQATQKAVIEKYRQTFINEAGEIEPNSDEFLAQIMIDNGHEFTADGEWAASCR